MFGQDPEDSAEEQPDIDPSLDPADDSPGTDDQQESDEPEEILEDEDDTGFQDPEDHAEEGEEVETPLEPVTVRAGGQVFTIPGAMRAPEGMYIPNEALDQVLSLIQRGRHHEMTYPAEQARYKAETQRLEALRNVDVAEAAAWTAEMTRVTESEDAFMAFVDNLAPNLESMKARVNQARINKENEVLRQGIRLEEPASELSGDDFVEAAGQTLLSYFDEMTEAPDLAAILPKEDRNQVWSQIARQANLYLTKAPTDDHRQGIKKGETVIDLERLNADITRLAQFLGHGRSRGQEGAGKATRAKQINAAVTQAGKRPAPRPRTRQNPTPVTDGNTVDDWRARILKSVREA